MNLVYHVVNEKTKTIRDVSEDDVVDHVTRQLTRNDPAMSWARARELAGTVCSRARENQDVTVRLYRVAVSVQ